MCAPVNGDIEIIGASNRPGTFIRIVKEYSSKVEILLDIFANNPRTQRMSSINIIMIVSRIFFLPFKILGHLPQS